MSRNTTVITDQMERYLEENFSFDDSFLSDMRSDAVNKGFPDISVSPLQASFLQILIKSINAKYILEIGSLYGYSAISMAKALTSDGKLVAIEKDTENADYIRLKSRDAGFADIITVYCDDANHFLKDYKPNIYFDLVFIDADKENYLNYFKMASHILRVGGLIIADNTLAFGHIADSNNNDPDINAIREFNKYITATTDFLTTLATIGDGLSISLKLQ